MNILQMQKAFSPDQSRMIKHAKFAYYLIGKALEKQTKKISCLKLTIYFQRPNWMIWILLN